MIKLIKKIREQTGAGMVDIKKALDEAKGDEAEALKILRKQGIAKADKKGGREAKEGRVASYVHTNGKVAALVKVLCETDFVARNEDFQELIQDIAMQVVAMDPLVVKPEEVPSDLVAEQKEVWKEEVKQTGKPEEIAQKIIEGKEKKFRAERALLTQSFIKDQERTVEEVLKEKISTIGENIVISEFVRLEI